jgi:transposase InsO family protein
MVRGPAQRRAAVLCQARPADRRALTDNGREFCGTERHPYELYLALNDIEHRKTKVGSPRTNGFVERFNGTVLEEFFRPTLRSRLYESIKAL